MSGKEQIKKGGFYVEVRHKGKTENMSISIPIHQEKDVLSIVGN